MPCSWVQTIQEFMRLHKTESNFGHLLMQSRLNGMECTYDLILRNRLLTISIFMKLWFFNNYKFIAVELRVYSFICEKIELKSWILIYFNFLGRFYSFVSHTWNLNVPITHSFELFPRKFTWTMSDYYSNYASTYVQ